MAQKQSMSDAFFGVATNINSASQRVYEDLRTRIVSLELEPDTTLSRVDLSKSYDVSQTPIREAMQRLEQDGLIRVYPQSRTVVSRIDVKQLRETHFLRVALECEVVRRVAVLEDRTSLAQARSYLSMQDSVSDKPDQMKLFNDLDRAFHQTLFEAVGMVNLFHMLGSKLGHLARCQRLELPMKGKAEHIIKCHDEILVAIENRDPEAAAEAMRAHLTGTILRISALEDQFPKYFSPHH